METNWRGPVRFAGTVNHLFTLFGHSDRVNLGEIAMFDFQRELLNRTIVAAATAKMDGFEQTAAALLAMAKDLNDEFAAGIASGCDGAFRSLQTKTAASPSRRLPH